MATQRIYLVDKKTKTYMVIAKELFGWTVYNDRLMDFLMDYGYGELLVIDEMNTESKTFDKYINQGNYYYGNAKEHQGGGSLDL